ncbi:ead/Ea22-like family protein [Escherichia coli]|nr:ead/Ea22-like family protein [Escherichia coli]EJN7557651.1 ead/Ea22-like family protein [Escherichia coli]EKD2535908.1 ead/Ea22-like family protein [Escherichia coli]EKD2538255.1 ead/Ea22-like family protein [Escherichia coli]EKK1341700.1 ead/Ea22-like family protein [Escherichia coli]
MSNIDKQALRQTAEKAQEHGVFNMDIHSQTVLELLDELEAAEALNKHLELAIRKADGCSEALRRKTEAAEKRIAELEAREVVLPQCYSMLHRVDFDEPYHTEMVYRQHQVLEALHNAGINVTESGKGEAS